MITFGCKVKIKHNFKYIKNIIRNLPKIAEQSVEDVLKNIRTQAIKLEKGHNEEGILCELIDTSNMEVKGRVYATPDQFMANGVSYLLFEYFGTGSYAEMEHIGKSKHFIESGFTEWFIPVNKVDKALPYPTIKIDGYDFYIAHGTKANHFLGDAEFETRNENKETVKKKIKEMLKECCK